MTDSKSPASSPRPFAAATDPSRYFPACAMEEARKRVGRSIQRGEGPVLVIGGAGLGKTMLLQVVAQQFREQIRSIVLEGGQLCTRRALLQMILFQLDLPYRGMDESELRLSLLSYLQPHDAEARHILILVDEADALPPRLLEELRVLTNASDAGRLLVNLVLAGNATLEEQFADPKLELFSQRVSARCYLSAFGREETFQYVCAQVTAAGNDPATLFASDGLEAIFAATDGVPRLVNQLGDQLMWMVSETGYSPLDSPIVQQAWSELQQLPAPWNTKSSEPAGSPVDFGEAVEFGELELDATELDDDGLIETEFVNDCYANENDDLPASIPINAAQSSLADEDGSELSGTEVFDATEDLLHQLHAMDTPQAESEDGEGGAVAPARNPFDETFESEEVVLDRYSVFESLLLAEAPRVANSSDSAFAQQLQHFEAVATPSVEQTPSSLVETSCPDDLLVIDEAPNDRTISANDLVEQPGEVLLIEDSVQPATEIVNGQKFRQLFSSLENASGGSCFG